MIYRSIPIDVDRIRCEMAEQGLNIPMLADKCLWDRQCLNAILRRGRCKPSTLEIIALALEVPLTELLADDTAQLKVMLDDGAYIPTRAYDSAGLDLYAMEGGVIPACGSASFDTGVHCAIPKGYVGLLTSKSGLMSDDEVTNRGTIDYDYRGSIREIQLVLALQDHGIAVTQQEIVQKTQVKMGIVGNQQGISLNHFRNITGNSGLGQTPLPNVLIGNARELLDFRRHETAGGEGDQLVIFLHHGGLAVNLLHNHGGKLDNLVTVEH